MDQLNKFLEESISTSARCQRNYDLSKEIRQEDLNTILTAIKLAPSKQNQTFFKVKVIHNREIIEEIYSKTSFWNWDHGDPNDGSERSEYLLKKNTNPQVLGKILIVFFPYIDENQFWESRSAEVRNAKNSNIVDEIDEKEAWEKYKNTLKINRERAVGVTSGYVSLVCEMLGLKSGFCQCSDGKAIAKMFSEEERPLLMMGIGYGDENRNRLEHHLYPEVKFRSFNKDIPIDIL